MKQIVTTTKSVDQATADLEAATKAHHFGVLAVHDLQATMKSKGVDFPNACRVLEICNPQKAAAVLSADMSLNMLLPCRISVYEENGETKIGTILPTALLGAFSDNEKLKSVAQEVEATTLQIIEAAL
jgi:uncharacterized protein (DUF302 family)